MNLPRGLVGGAVVLGHEGGGQAGGGVLGHEGAQVRGDAGRGPGGRVVLEWLDDAAHALGVARLVDGQQCGEVAAGARVDEVDAAQVPTSDADAELDEGAVGGGELEADAFDGGGAVAAALEAGDLGAEPAAELVGAGALATDGWATDEAREGASP